MKKIVYVLLTIALSLVTLNAKSYKYDDLNRVIEVSYESGEKIFYAYDSAGNMLDVRYALEIETYHLNDSEVTNTSITPKIQDAIAELEDINADINNNTDYDALKTQLDTAMSKMDAVKQAIDNSNLSESEKIALKDEADKIKREIDAIKILIDGYKADNNYSNSAIADIGSRVEAVIAMMVMDKSKMETESISVKKGRNTISGNIDVSTLSDKIHSVWIVDKGNWYGYSSYATVRDEIEAKYLLIDTKIVGNEKGMIVFAMEDTEIESLVREDSDMTHEYGRGYTLHGVDGEGLHGEDVVCTQNTDTVLMMAKVRGDEPSVYVSDREIAGIENFEYLSNDDGYYVLCDKE